MTLREYIITLPLSVAFSNTLATQGKTMTLSREHFDAASASISKLRLVKRLLAHLSNQSILSAEMRAALSEATQATGEAILVLDDVADLADGPSWEETEAAWETNLSQEPRQLSSLASLVASLPATPSELDRDRDFHFGG